MRHVARLKPRELVEPPEAQPEPRVGFRAFRRLLCPPSMKSRVPDRRCHLVSLLVAGEASSHPISLTRGVALFPKPHLGPAWRRFWPKIYSTSQVLKAQSEAIASRPALVTLNSQAVSVDPSPHASSPVLPLPELGTMTCRRQLPRREDDAPLVGGPADDARSASLGLPDAHGLRPPCAVRAASSGTSPLPAPRRVG